MVQNFCLKFKLDHNETMKIQVATHSIEKDRKALTQLVHTLYFIFNE